MEQNKEKNLYLSSNTAAQAAYVATEFNIQSNATTTEDENNKAEVIEPGETRTEPDIETCEPQSAAELKPTSEKFDPKSSVEPEDETVSEESESAEPEPAEPASEESEPAEPEPASEEPEPAEPEPAEPEPASEESEPLSPLEID